MCQYFNFFNDSDKIIQHRDVDNNVDNSVDNNVDKHDNMSYTKQI